MFIKKQENELQIQRKLQKAGALLGFSKNQAVTAEMVRKKFTTMAKFMHPDNTTDAMLSQGAISYGPIPTLDSLRKAKDLLVKHMEEDDA